MPVRGLEHDSDMATLHADGVTWVGEAPVWLDVHTHIGHHDPDGLEADPEELVDALDQAGHDQACVFAMHEPHGYRHANDVVLAACEASHGRLLPLARVSPHAEDARAELARCLEEGARGVKLHPRSDAFGLDHPEVEGLVEQVAQIRGVVLVHAGRGIPELGRHAVALAEAHPDARIVLAHAGISDVGLLVEHTDELANLLFDTSWWQPSDLLQLLTTVPPGRILYASDMPYGPPRAAATLLLRCAQQAGLRSEQVREMVGAQARRALLGEDLLDLGPAPGPDALGPRVLSFERAAAYLTAGVQGTFRGADPAEAYALARLACQRPGAEAPHAAALEVLEEYVAMAQDRLEAERNPFAAVEAGMAALLVAATPGVAARPPAV